MVTLKNVKKLNLNENMNVIFLKNNKKYKSKLLTNNNFNFAQDIIIDNKNIVVGIKNIKTKDQWRKLGFEITKKVKSLFNEINIEVPNSNSQEFIDGLLLGSYVFNKYKSNKIPIDTKLKTIYISSKDGKSLKSIINNANIKVRSQFLTRDLVNNTAEDAQSSSIEKRVIKEFKNNKNIKITIYNEKDLKKFNMNGHLAVNRASRHEAKTIKIEYTPSSILQNPKHILLVGKGLTYDSGGLSIKPTNSMIDMQADKAGAMSVLGIMKGVSKKNSNIKVTAYLAIAENMIDGKAYKPGDILTMKNGKTVFIANTDAEGRIVLFDNICLAIEENKKFDEIYTFATLTGAAVYQFGDETTAMVGFNDKLKKNIKKYGKKEGEIFIDAAFHKYMLDGVKHSIADLTNTGTSNMGCQKAGLFLTNAVPKKHIKKYLHLDIAGPAFISKPFDTNIEGGTGFSVRTFINYLS
jgi:leucyl aminopeptidase